MPMYEYVCMKCEEHFEELVRGDQEVACPHCGGNDVARQLSTFSMIGTAGQTGAFGSGGGCCGGTGGRGHLADAPPRGAGLWRGRRPRHPMGPCRGPGPGFLLLPRCPTRPAVCRW